MTRQLGRRGFLGLAALTAGGVSALAAGALAAPGLLRPGQPGMLLRSGRPLPAPYQVPLPIPPVIEPVRRDGSTDYYEIDQRVSDIAVLDGIRTPAWTYQGIYPGPTIVSRSGRRTVVRHTNHMPHPVVVHLHGGHTPHDSDGYPADLILPVGSPVRHHSSMAGMPTSPGIVTLGTRAYTYPLNQRAATLWYHDHRMGFTGPGVWYGLAGFHLVQDEEEDALPLPKGERDVPIMIADRSFDADGRIQYPAIDQTLSATAGVQGAYMNGVLGDVILANGAPWPVMTVLRRKYRLRLLNASNARRYRLTLDPPPPGGAGFVQIGSDGGLLAHPITHDAIEIAPAITDLHHPIHLHLDQFQVLARNGGDPGPYDHGWKDTLDLYPAESAEIIVKFTDYAGRFLFHCHNLEHEDMAMMADFITS
jgi:FtsP/CotA-like multicopper oxidase with cupredoxin domain